MHSNSYDVAVFDLAVIGTGFHGISIAREARRCGLSVVLIHDKSIIDCPAIPYHAVLGADIGKLESLNFTEVMANQKELNQLQNIAPQLVQQLPVFISHNGDIRSTRRVKFGIRAYRSLQKKVNKYSRCNIQPHTLSKDQLIGIQSEAVFSEQINDYSVLPKRLLIGIAQDAVNIGVEDLPCHIVKHGQRDEEKWQLKVRDRASSAEKLIHAKAVINCASCSIDQVLHDILKVKTRCQSKTIHSAWVYINKPQQWSHALMLQLKNKTLPYVFSVNQTTLCAGPIIVESDNTLDKQLAINNMLDELNNTTKFESTTDDIVRCEWHTESIFDTLNGNIHEAYNETYIDVNNRMGLAPVVSIFGTNVAQFNKVAYECLNVLQDYFPQMKGRDQHQESLTIAPLLSGNSDELAEHRIEQILLKKYPALEINILLRMYHSYGDAIQVLLADLSSSEDITIMGAHFGHGLYAKEVDYLIAREWVASADDVLWRNTNLGLLFDADQKQKLATYISEKTT